jgi:hypothetical protein
MKTIVVQASACSSRECGPTQYLFATKVLNPAEYCDSILLERGSSAAVFLLAHEAILSRIQ